MISHITWLKSLKNTLVSGGDLTDLTPFTILVEK